MITILNQLEEKDMSINLNKNKYIIKYVIILIVCLTCTGLLLYFHTQLMLDYQMYSSSVDKQTQIEHALKIYKWILIIASILLPTFIITIVIITYDVKNIITQLNKLTNDLYNQDIEYIDQHFKNQQLQNVVNAWNKNIDELANEKSIQNEYINNTVHDFKMPIQILQSNVDMYKKKYGTNEYVQAIEDEIGVLDTEIMRALVIEKINYFDKPSFSLRNIYSDVIVITSKYDGIDFTINVYGKYPNNVEYDYDYFSKIINNLIENAYKYSSDKQMNIYFEDNHLYLSNKVAKKVENLFTGQRIDTLPKGNGLGTEIIKKYIELLNWKINSYTKDDYFIVKIDIRNT